MKILIVGSPASIHTGRFSSMLAELGEDVRVFNCELDEGVDEHLGPVAIYQASPGTKREGEGACLSWAPRTVLARMLDPRGDRKLLRKVERRYLKWRRRNSETPIIGQAFGFRNGAIEGVNRVIDTWRPDLVISLKMQNDGYTVAAAKRSRGGGFPPWLHFNWGTDIAYYGVDPYHTTEHLPKIRDVLATCDMHIADCDRDVRLARELGFSGVSLGSCLATGGFNLAEMAAVRAKAKGPKRSILVKGRNWPLRESGQMPISVGLKTMEALSLAAPTIIESDLTVKIVLATPDVAAAARSLASKGVKVEVLKRLPYDELLMEFVRARFTVSSTLVDGTPLFLAETMVLGSVPLHSDIESIREWVANGENGLLFEPEDVVQIAAAIERACRDDAFIGSASARNLAIAEERMDREKIGPWFLERLRAAMAEIGAKARS